MSQVIMLFLFPIGAYFYFFVERKNRPAYEKVFSDFQTKIQNTPKLSSKETLENYQNMLLKNGYEITETSETKVVGKKRIFSMSLFAMGIGLYFVGAVFYLLYNRYLQKPHQITFKVT